MIRQGVPGAIALAVLLGLTLTGCDPHTVGPATDSAAPSESPSASETPSAVPTEEPASGALGPQDAYDRCVQLVGDEFYAGRPVTYAPFGSADVILRTDGLYYVYAETTVADAPTPEEQDVAIECILGGTFEAPNDALYGTSQRAPLSARNPDSPLSAED